MQIYKRIKRGLINVFQYCALWVGTLVVYLILIDSNNSWWIRLGMGFLIISAFVSGYFDKSDE